MKILGIDPAFASTGLAMATLADTVDGPALKVDWVHLLRTAKNPHKQVRKSSDDLARARMLRERLLEAVRQADVVMVEVPHGTQSARAAWTLGVALGVLAGIGPFIEVTAREVKLATVGRVTASKQDMIKWAMTRHPEADGWIRTRRRDEELVSPMNEHLADAVAVLYAGLATEDFQRLLNLTSVSKIALTNKVGLG